MTKISLNDPKDFDIQKDIWKTYGITQTLMVNLIDL